VGFVGYAAFLITRKVVRSKTAWILMILSALISFKLSSPYTFPILILAGGAITAFKYKKHPVKEKDGLHIQWSNFILWAGVFILAASLGGLTRALPVRLFENFYRSGSLIFGGGQVLIPFLYAEFVELKQLLTSEEFLTGYAIGQSVPGPVFSFCAYVGALSMRQFGTSGQILGSFVASVGIFLPGIFLIFFVIRFWDSLKKYRWVRASLEGVNAVSSGMVVAASILLFIPLGFSFLNAGLVITTFLILMFTRVPAPLIILAGLIAGIWF
jgi:chromate transporter